MAAKLFFLPFSTVFTANGLPQAGALLYFYLTGTTTPSPVYTTSGLSIAHPSPVVANSAGRFPAIYLDSTVTYRLVIKDSTGVTLDDVDPLIPGVFYGSTTTSSGASTSLRDLNTLAVVADNLRQGIATTAAYYGDSNGVGVIGQLSGSTTSISVNPPPVCLQAIVNDYFGNTAFTVVNKSVSGATTAQLLAGNGVYTTNLTSQILATPASVAFINLGTNDAEGVNAITGDAYKANLKSMVAQFRANAQIPVIITHFPGMAIGFNGSARRAERSKAFADIARMVAIEDAVAIVDINALVEKMLSGSKYGALDLLPDGVHGTEALFLRAGYTMARCLLGPVVALSRDTQFVKLDTGNVQATGLTFTASTSARFGTIASTTGATAKTMRVLFDVAEPGLDVAVAHTVVSSGSNATNVVLNGTTATTISMNDGTAYTGATTFAHDCEATIAENIDPGLHLIKLTSTSSALDIALTYLRGRPMSPFAMFAPVTNGAVTRRRILKDELLLVSTGVSYALDDELYASNTLHNIDLEFTAQLVANSGLVISGHRYGSPSGSPSTRFGFSLHLNASGFLTITEATSGGTSNSTVLDSVDRTGSSVKYRIKITPAWVATAYVNGTQIGSPVSLTQKYRGGQIGVWRATAGNVTITNLTQVFE